MATQENVRINFVTAFDGKGLNNAKQQLGGFDALASKALKTFTGLFAAQKVAAFGKASLDAFTADQKAAQALSQTLMNLGLGFQSTGVEDFIQKLETTTGILDEQLRPAFATLARSTGSVAKSQELLNLALDISAGTGKDLASVSTALSKAYLGQTTALGRLGAGLSKSELASKNFSTIQARLTALFAGQASTAAETYAGKIAKLGVAFDNMKESIGQGLVLAFENLSGPQGSIAKTTDMIQNLGYAISGWLQGLGTFVAGVEGVFSKIASNPVIKWILDHSALNRIGGIFSTLVDAGKQAAYTEKLKANTKALEQAYAQQKKGLATSQTQLSVDKAALALKQASKVLDLQQIEIYAAMQNAKGNDLERLQLQQAILDGNAKLATTLADKVLAANSLILDTQGKIVDNPLAGWVLGSKDFLKNLQDSYASLLDIQKRAGALVLDTGVTANPSSMPAFTPLTQQTINSIAGGGDVGFALAAANFQNQMSEIKVTVDPSAMAYGISLATQNQSSNGTAISTSRNNPIYLNPSSGL
jgi:hypothetical protein